MSELSIKNLTTGGKITAIASFIVVVSFFLPWFTNVILGGIPISKNSGFTFAMGGTSISSGLPLQMFFITPIAAIVCLFLCAMYITKGKKTDKMLPLTQIVLSVISMLPFFLLPIEIGYWQGVGLIIHFGFWITILGTIGMLMGALLSYKKIKKPSEKEGDKGNIMNELYGKKEKKEE